MFGVANEWIVGVPVMVAPSLHVILAPNASPMTGPGTNTYLLGDNALVVIDPGPADDPHIAAIIHAINGRPVSHILVTHSHLDHTPGAKPLSQMTGAPVCGFGTSDTGRSDIMESLLKSGYLGGGEGIDPDFAPDILLSDMADIETGAGMITALHTPGHMGNHMAFEWNDVTFVGDLVMGWSTSLVSPPDGDMTDFFASCARLADRPARVFYPGHGAPIETPHARLCEIVTHRQNRTVQIIDVLCDGPLKIMDIVSQLYVDTPTALHPIAARNVFAHLIDLHGQGLVTAAPKLGPDATYARL